MRENHRGATIFAGIFSLIQAVIWCIIAIYSVAIFSCNVAYPFKIDAFKLDISDLLYISYYYGTCRTPPGLPLIEAPSALRTYYWMLIYGIISAIWIPTSSILLVGSITKIKGCCGSFLLIPWILNTTVLLIMDIVASVIYGIDISNTLTGKTYAEFVRPLDVDAKNTEGIATVPAIIMTVFFSRIVIIWFINFILLIVVIQASRSLRQPSPTVAFIENEARVKGTNDGSSSQWVNMRSNDMSLKRLPRLQIEESPQIRSRSPTLPISPQSPMSETPPPPLRPAPLPIPIPPAPLTPEALPRGNSSPVYDVYGKHLGNVLPEEIHKHIPINDAAKKSGLSNQVPWSYAQPGELNLRIKQAALHNQEAAKPQIPMPDYTVHFPPEKRPTIKFSSLTRSDSSPSSSLAYGMYERA